MLDVIKCMTCEDDPVKFRSKVPEKNMWYSQKLDGVRTLAYDAPTTGCVYYFSRNGKRFHNFSKFDKSVRNMAGALRERLQIPRTQPVWFDGEVISVDQQFQGVMQQLRRHKSIDDSVFQYHLFDLPNHGGSLYRRLMTLDSLVNVYSLSNDIFMVPHFLAESWSKVQQVYEEALRKGQEGIVVKDYNSLYETRKSTSWLKMKMEDTLDLPVIGTKPGKGKYTGLIGTLTCLLPNGKTVDVSGFSDSDRVLFSTVRPEMIEVKHNGETSGGKLRHPRFVCVREDK